MKATPLASATDGRDARLSVLSVSLTAALASVSHAYDFGPPAFLAGALVISLLAALGLGYQRTGNRFVLVLYVLLSLWIVAGFGIVGGFWNNGVKLAACAIRGGPLPPSAAPWFTSLEPGSGVSETAGVLTFVASLAAAVFGYRFVRAIHARREG